MKIYLLVEIMGVVVWGLWVVGGWFGMSFKKKFWFKIK